MPHGGPHQKTTFNSNRPKTDTRPKGIPSFLSSSEPKKSFSQMTSQERTDRFNKNQDKYKKQIKQFKKKHKLIPIMQIGMGMEYQMILNQELQNKKMQTIENYTDNTKTQK